MSDPSNTISRRHFLKASSAAAVAAGVGMRGKMAQAQTASASGNTIRVGFIGIGGRGAGLLNEFKSQPDVKITAVCDVYKTNLDNAAAAVGAGVQSYHDFRDLLDKAPVDAVVVATPPHWHPLISLAAMEAGKDVYCEKPLALYPDEARALVQSAIKNKRITQVGTQIHAGENFRRVVEIVRSGALGKISAVRTQVTLNEAPGGCPTTSSAQPEGLDWDMWLGPLAKQPFNEGMFTVHRYYKQCVHSWVNELGPHIMDLAVWAMDPGEPKLVCATGGRYATTDGSDIPDTVDVCYQYPDYNMTFMHTASNGYNFGFGPAPDKGRRLAVFFHGTNGTLAADYGSHQLYLEGVSPDDFKPAVETIPPSPGHAREFLDCVVSRKLASCSFQYHYPLAVALTLSHVSLFSGETVGWDAAKGKVIGSKKVEQLAKAPYRAPWKLPK